MDELELRVSPHKTFLCEDFLSKGMPLSSIINTIKKAVKSGGGGGGQYDPYYDESRPPAVEYAENEPSEEPDVEEDDQDDPIDDD